MVTVAVRVAVAFYGPSGFIVGQRGWAGRGAQHSSLPAGQKRHLDRPSVRLVRILEKTCVFPAFVGASHRSLASLWRPMGGADERQGCLCW